MESNLEKFKNPFRPGAGQKPPYLAGRKKEMQAFSKLLEQTVVFRNMILTGLRGTGKTVLSETFTPIALERGWLWIGTDLSESASVSEETLAIRLLTDLSVATSQVIISSTKKEIIGFTPTETEDDKIYLNYETLASYYSSQPGLVADKHKATLEWVWAFIKPVESIKGVVFAYDEAQNMSDQGKDRQYPLSMMLDIFQSLQRKEIPFFILLIGLPPLFPKLVAARTYSERMFEIVELKSLEPAESREAITKPIEQEKCPVGFEDELINLIIEKSGGYPYFIQFICREVYDYYLGQVARGEKTNIIPLDSIVAKLDTVFFAGRWNNITDRQRELMSTIASLPNYDQEFTIQDRKHLSRKRL